MLFNKKQIQSSIIKDEKLELYRIKLPWICRYFESIIFSYNWLQKAYWKLSEKFKNINLDNKLIWVTVFNNYYIICFIDLNNLNSKYFFVKSFDMFEIRLDSKKYSIFIYKTFDEQIWYFCDYDWNEYIFEISEKFFVVKNAMFDTEVFYQLLELNNFIKNKEIKLLKTKTNDLLDIADFYIFDDYFIKSDNENFDDFYKFIWNINNKVIQIHTDLNIKIKVIKYDDLYYPKIKINLSIFSKDIEKFELKDFRKLLLSFFSENISCYIINNKNINNYFSEYIHDFTNIKFDELDLDFHIPNNIYKSDKLFEKFKLDLLKLRYNLLLLKDSYNLKDIKINHNSEYTKLLNNRLNMNKKSLETTIFNYEKKLSKLLENLKKLV